MRQSLRALVTLLCVILSAEIAICQRPVKTDSQANLPPTDTGTEAKESMPRPYWTVKYLAGSPHLDLGSWLRIAFAPQSATLVKQNLFITVRADQIVSVGYSANAERESDLLERPRSGCSDTKSMMPDLAKSRPEDMIATKVTPGRGSRLSEKLIRHHPVHLVWIEERKQQQVTVNINECEYEALIANFRWLLGTRWVEVARNSTK